MNTYKDLIVWQKSMELVKEIYLLTESFPKEEIFGLTSQIRRCAVSIPSNIAEGKLRGTDAQFKQFLSIAYGSGGELETQLLIAQSLPKTGTLSYIKANELLTEVMKMINKLLAPKA